MDFAGNIVVDDASKGQFRVELTFIYYSVGRNDHHNG
jgi:hypothetical protein